MVPTNLNQKSCTYSLSHQNLQEMCQDHSKSTSQPTLHSLMGSPSLSKCSLANQPLRSAVWDKLQQCHVSYSYHNISVWNVLSGLCSSCVLFHKRPSYFYTSVIYSRQWEWKIDKSNVLYSTHLHLHMYNLCIHCPNTLILTLIVTVLLGPPGSTTTFQNVLSGYYNWCIKVRRPLMKSHLNAHSWNEVPRTFHTLMLW